MKIYRIARNEYCDVSGEGAKRFGGRWNLHGIAVLYGGSSVSSSLLERLTIDPELFASERYVLYSIMELDCPENLIFKPRLDELPEKWDAIPPEKSSQVYGTTLIQSGIFCFAVPSIVDKSSLNYVINPFAQEFKALTIKIYPLELDSRIIKRS